MKLIFKRVQEIDRKLDEHHALIVKLLTNRNADVPEVLLLTQDVVRIFSVSERTIYDWRMTKVLPFVKIGRTIYFRQSDVDDLRNRGAA